MESSKGWTTGPRGNTCKSETEMRMPHYHQRCHYPYPFRLEGKKREIESLLRVVAAKAARERKDAEEFHAEEDDLYENTSKYALQFIHKEQKKGERDLWHFLPSKLVTHVGKETVASQVQRLDG